MFSRQSASTRKRYQPLKIHQNHPKLTNPTTPKMSPKIAKMSISCHLVALTTTLLLISSSEGSITTSTVKSNTIANSLSERPLFRQWTFENLLRQTRQAMTGQLNDFFLTRKSMIAVGEEIGSNWKNMAVYQFANMDFECLILERRGGSRVKLVREDKYTKLKAALRGCGLDE